MNRKDLKSLTLDELKNLFESIGEKSFRGQQAFKWIHKKMINSIDDITEFSKILKDKLNQEYKITKLQIVKRLDSKIDETKKYLFLLEDGNIIESVMMKYKHGISVCISTQVGCKMGCSFCASTKGGFIRNLTPGEIVDQVYQIQKDLNVKVSNIVLMGSGEPLDNFNNVIKFLELIHCKSGQNLGYRHITLSTCGIVPRIYDLANLKIPVTLSISLHSAFDDERKKIMPIANKYTIKDILDACRYYINKTNRRVTFEYTLINSVNDSERHANELAKLLSGMLCHVNLIPLNPIKEANFKTSKGTNVLKFKEILESRNINTTVRREMGGDINAACGQLRRDYMNENRL
ncbi:ribosomal RNA large subunit methyltransferase N [Caloranaerobacter azorensis H53214]|uniref:Probable dual-specificity RNA methyltransferase RlmN n=1 Tax=Caloranaerobacter azorensis H53214 TaxID=1156417 RepID=A0A096BK51_9FIRM|nr:23S rRNA (adenine(2503)-C(2))-methyltransferase RlmN [Caloranaerobacter azorensis]KGG81118.1 ribosomal RNA large subunit methyltransferase N [Caloranaerobacter azorensis H53214]